MRAIVGWDKRACERRPTNVLDWWAGARKLAGPTLLPYLKPEEPKSLAGAIAACYHPENHACPAKGDESRLPPIRDEIHIASKEKIMNRRVGFIAGAVACTLVLLLAGPGWAAKPRAIKPPVTETVVAKPAPIADVVSGKVFLDAKGNGRPEDGKPLPDIRVTDGVNIVTTGPDGSYTLPIGDDFTTPQKGSRTIAVNWPSGKWPSGRWWTRVDQIADARHVDFFLRDDDQPLPFAFLQVSDDHAAGWPYNTFGPPAARLKPMLRFLVNTGDTGDCSVSHKNALKFPVPVMTVPGNHDIFNHGPQRFLQDPMAGNGAYTRSLGPVRWSFDYAGVHFAGMDWMDPSIPVEINGNVSQVAAEWLEKDLRLVKPGTRIFVFVHFPSGCDKYYEVIAKYKVSQVFAGHIHEYKHLEYGGVPAVTAVNFIAGGNLIVVEKDDFSLAEFCLGCKKLGPSATSSAAR